MGAREIVYKTKKDWKKNCIVDRKTGCWLWKHGKFSKGYGSISVPYGVMPSGRKLRGKAQRASIYAYELFKGQVPKGCVVAHSCDMPPCVNPKHLFAHTHSRNCADGWARGKNSAARRRIISEIGSRVRSAETIAKFRKSMRKSRKRRSENARRQMHKLWQNSEYRVSQSAVIRRGKGLAEPAYSGESWGHVVKEK